MSSTAAIGAGNSSAWPPASSSSGATSGSTATSGTTSAASQAVQLQLAELAQVDRHVRSHEQAHLAAAGRYATSGPSFQYAYGPDGKQYAIGGEVGIDVSPVAGDPEATLEKARTVEAAADAPTDPSAQDRAVAAQAAQMERQALEELRGTRVSVTA